MERSRCNIIIWIKYHHFWKKQIAPERYIFQALSYSYHCWCRVRLEPCGKRCQARPKSPIFLLGVRWSEQLRPVTVTSCISLGTVHRRVRIQLSTSSSKSESKFGVCLPWMICFFQLFWSNPDLFSLSFSSLPWVFPISSGSLWL